MDISSAEEDVQEKKEWEPRKEVEIRQYTLNDLAGNSLVMVLKHKKERNEVKVKIITTQYNGGAVLPATKNKITASSAYSKGKKAALQELQQWITVKKQFDVWAKYSAQKGKTEIKVEIQGQKPKTETEKGIVILELLTDKGGLKYKY
jgi:predicted RNA-binding protein with RPS1 domain